MLAMAKNRQLQQLLLLFTDPPGHRELRQRTGRLLLDLLNADQFASFIWQPELKQYGEAAHWGMSDCNMHNYATHFQYHDPITEKLQRRASATDVGEVMPYGQLRRTAFYNDFLRVDGLFHGMNAHAVYGRHHFGDLRIWRGKHRSAFDTEDRALLEFLRPLFCNALRQCNKGDDTEADLRQSAAELDLSPREQEVVLLLCQGHSDKRAAQLLGMAVTTLRTHLRNSYRKLEVNSRSALMARLIDHSKNGQQVSAQTGM